MSPHQDSIFRRYYAHQAFVDRFLEDRSGAVDLIIPVIHTNELWEANLLSFYREIPIHRLLIGDGGCLDDSITIARKFPRVVVEDHRSYRTLGYSIRKLIEAVQTEWFIYLHSDVFLPECWFDTMRKHQAEHDWFGCPMQHTVMVEYLLREKERPYAGSQMGKKAAFEKSLAHIDDDFVYRQEDFVFANIVEQAGFRLGKVEDTFHYHQTMHKPSPWSRTVKSVRIETELSAEEELRTFNMQLRGIIKYLDPSLPWLINDVLASINRLQQRGALDLDEFKTWVAQTNPKWLAYLRRRTPLKKRLRAFLGAAYHLIHG